MTEPIREFHPMDTATTPFVRSMTLRDWFAGMALSGMLGADGNDPRWTGRDVSAEYQRGGGKWIDPNGVAQQSYEIADAMLSARKHKGIT